MFASALCAQRAVSCEPQVLSFAMCVGAAVPMRLRPLPASLFKEPNRLLPPVAPAPGLLAFPLCPPLREALERTHSHCYMNMNIMNYERERCFRFCFWSECRVRSYGRLGLLEIR